MIQRVKRLELIAGLLALGVTAIHLYWGIPRFAVYASIGKMPDPRPLAFVLSGHLIMVGVTLVAAGSIAKDRVYLSGIGLMIVHLVSYAAWHTVLGHGGVENTHSHSHVGVVDAVITVGEHLVNSPLALVSKVLEFALLGCLLVLYLRGRQP